MGENEWGRTPQEELMWQLDHLKNAHEDMETYFPGGEITPSALDDIDAGARMYSVAFLMNNQPDAVIEDMGLVTAIRHLRVGDTTALVWIGEVTE